MLGRPFTLEVWTRSFLMDELSRDPDNMTRKYCAVFAQGRGVARDKSDTFNARRGIPTPNLREWAQQNLTA